MTMSTQPHEVIDFSGGFTDNYVDGPVNQGQYFDNLLITNNRKPISRPGSVVYDLLNAQAPSGAQRIGALINRDTDTDLIAQSARNLFRYDPAGWETLQGPTGEPVFDVGTTANHVAYSEWNKHLFLTNDAFARVTKVYQDGSGNLQVRTAGLPEFPSLPSIAAGAAGSDGYIYAFVFMYEYTVENLTFRDYSAPVYKELASAAPPNTNPVSITGIPSLAPSHNWDTVAVKIQIYRTIANGQSLYFVGEISNGTASYIDSVADTTLLDRELLYTTGEVSPNHAPPLCKYLHITRDTAFFAHLKEGTDIYPNRVRQSIPGDPDSSPDTYYVDVGGEIRGISSVNGVPIVLCKRGIYRLEGGIDELGGGDLIARMISDTHGCVSHNSIVQTNQGIYWAGADGFCFSDGVKVMKISDHINQTYRDITLDEERAKRIYGTMDPEGARIYWGCQREAGSTDNDSVFVLDLRWGLRPDSCFTSLSGGTSFSPTALVYFDQELIRADRRGYFFRHSQDLRSDPTINTLTLASTWGTQEIVYRYRSCSLNYGTSFVRKWVPKIVVTCRNEGNLNLQIRSNNDDSGVFKDLAPLRFRGAFTWGDGEFTWGDPQFIWNYNGLIEEVRRFPAKTLRCSHKQIEITNAKATIAVSTSASLGTVDPIARTVVLSGSAYTWPAEAVGWTIAFEHDGYVKEYPITTRSNDTLSYIDPAQAVQSGAQGWRILGYPKNETFHLLGYVIHVAMMSQSQKGYQADTEGAAAWSS